jgi:heparan-alpha-glucosaminide N-acetyltransferase
MDAYRGFVMICLAANGFGLAATARNFPNCSIMQSIGPQFDHVPWVGGVFWDLIQPSFMFLVGVAVPYSLTRRENAGDSAIQLTRHVLLRSLLLILLGIFLSSIGKPTTNFAFMNVLAQIGLGYPFLFLLRNRAFGIQVAVTVSILAGYWAWFAFSPVVPVQNPQEINLHENWKLLNGFEAHWQKNANPAARFDDWLLNLFPARSEASAVKSNDPPVQPESSNEPTDPPAKASTDWISNCGKVVRRLVTRPEPYVFNSGGYQTLNFIPSFVNMVFGLMAGEFIRRAQLTRARTFACLLFAGLLLLSLGWIWQAVGGCPLVKRIWTPSWTLFSTGWTLLILSGFYGIIDGLGWKAWAFPLIVAGMNSMVLYMSGQLLRGWTADLLKRHIHEDLFKIFGDRYAPMVKANLVLVCFWLFVYWLYRQRIFVRI